MQQSYGVCGNKHQKKVYKSNLFFHSLSIKTLNVWQAGNRAIRMRNTPVTCMCLNMYTEHTHKPHSRGCRVTNTNTYIIDGGHYQCVLSMLAVYSWDEIAEQGQNYNTYKHRQTQWWLSNFKCLKNFHLIVSVLEVI